MDDAAEPTIRFGGGDHESTAAAERCDVVLRLREPIMGMVSMSRICAHWLSRKEPDLDEVRKLVAMLTTCSEETLAILEAG